MEDLIFVALFVAIPATLLIMGFIAVLTRERRDMKEQRDELEENPPPPSK